MTDANYLRDSLRAMGSLDVHTCTLCGALIPRSWVESHNAFHAADYERLATADQGTSAEICERCGVLVNRAYETMHDRVHQADYEPFAAGAEAESCKLCGILIGRNHQAAHLEIHA